MTLALTKRAEKGSAITIAEHDANFDAIESEVNAKLEAGSAITDLDGTAWRVIYVDGSGDVVELGLGTSGQVLKSNGASSAPSFEDETAGGGGDLDNLVEDTTPQLGGDLDVNGNSIVSASDGDVVIEPDGTGEIQLNAADVLVEEDIVHSGDTNNKIVFGTDTQDFQTGGSSRLDISDSGVRLGGANARVTTVLDEDTLSSDSATALATQQSIKAYVDEIKFTEADDATDYGGTNASFKVGSDGASIGEQRRFTDNGDHDLEFIAANLNDGDYGWLIKGGTGTVTLVYNDINLNGDTADIELKSIVKWTVHDGEVLIEGGTDEDVDLEDVVVQRPELKDYSETSTTPASASGTLTLDLENGNVFQVTLDEDVTTLTLSNPPASGKAGAIFLIIVQDTAGSHSITWPGSVKWPGGTAPTLTGDGESVDIVSLVTRDGGTTWYGFEGGLDFS